MTMNQYFDLHLRMRKKRPHKIEENKHIINIKHRSVFVTYIFTQISQKDNWYRANGVFISSCGHHHLLDLETMTKHETRLYVSIHLCFLSHNYAAILQS